MRDEGVAVGMANSPDPVPRLPPLTAAHHDQPCHGEMREMVPCHFLREIGERGQSRFSSHLLHDGGTIAQATKKMQICEGFGTGMVIV